MSGPIRQQLALAKARLKRYLDELTDHRPFLQDNLSADENVDRLTELKNNLVFERNRIDKTSQLIDQKNSEWAEYLRTLADNELKNEQALYDQTTETADSFLHFWDTAQEKLSTIDSWLFEIDSLLGPLLLQRTGAGPSGGISATTSASAAILNSTVAIPIPSATTSASAAPAIPPQHPVQQLQQLRLPKLEIKPFYGNPVEWNEFYDAFTSSVHSQHIHDVQKFAYLKGFLRGQALQSIEGIPMNNANYNEALQILRNRFGDGDLIKQALYSQFRKLPTVQRLRADELRPFVDSMEKTCRQLSALGELLDHQSLAGVLMEKLPAAVIIKLEEQYKGANQGSWSLQQLREALGKLVAVQEKVNRISDVPQRQPIQQPSQSQQKGRAQSQRQFQPGYQPRSSADAFVVHKMERQPNRKFPMVRKDGQQSRPVVAAKPREPKSPCILCGGAHFNDSCSAFPSLESRKKKLRELNRCFICLRNGCHASYCRQVHRRCFHCQKIGEHSRMLCPNLLQKGVTNSTSSAAPMQRQKESTHVHLNKTATVGDSPPHLNPAQSISSSQSAPAEEVSVGKVENLNNAKRLAYLLTAEAYVINPSSKVGHVNVKVFLDSGSQKTFITNKLVEKLKLPIIERETLSIFTFGAQKPCVVDSSIVSFDMILQNGTCLKIEANALEKMTGNMKKGALSTEDLEYLKQIPVQYLAESLPYQQRSFEPDIMIGQDYFWDIMDTGEKQQLPSGMYLLPSKLGLLLGGRYKGAEEAFGSHTYPAVVVQDPLIVSTARQKDSTTDAQDCLEKFWRLESIGIMDSPAMKEDDHAIENFNNTI
ncbi:MAG: DUF1759 domain-containing protein, partial [Gammaproteobacteria bacterium]|nr:DUF1759 domain-containing protein [Gammaproteobacteria bacterium]